jgi:flagellar protein FliO/FliZ
MSIPTRLSRILLFAAATIILLVTSSVGVAAESTAAIAGSDVADAGNLWDPTLRMVLSLSAVLALLGGCTWLAKRVRNGASFKSGMIEVISGVSLGGREKVVLLRVGGDEILVGVSPTGMRPLHVLRKRPEPSGFSNYMEKTE